MNTSREIIISFLYHRKSLFQQSQHFSFIPLGCLSLKPVLLLISQSSLGIKSEILEPTEVAVINCMKCWGLGGCTAPHQSRFPGLIFNEDVTRDVNLK